MLEMQKASTYRGQAQILRQISLTVRDQESVVLVGRNGAGKTTTIDTLIGLLPMRSGKITFQGGDIGSLPPYKRARMGIGYAPEDSGLFPELTVAENFEICRWQAQAAGRAGQGAEVDERVFAVFPEVRKFMERRGAYLSGGQKKMVAIARAMMLAPSVRLIDAVKKIKEMKISLLIAESNVANASRIADRLYAIDRGEIIYEGDPKKVLENKEVMSTIHG